MTDDVNWVVWGLAVQSCPCDPENECWEECLRLEYETLMGQADD